MSNDTYIILLLIQLFCYLLCLRYQQKKTDLWRKKAECFKRMYLSAVERINELCLEQLENKKRSE